jgi:hypothetical protein
MVIELFERRQVIVQDICLDDDASTRALLRWSNKDWMLNNNTTVVPTVPITKGKNKGNHRRDPIKGNYLVTFRSLCSLQTPITGARCGQET